MVFVFCSVYIDKKKTKFDYVDIAGLKDVARNNLGGFGSIDLEVCKF